jgi:hypothetical protein
MVGNILEEVLIEKMGDPDEDTTHTVPYTELAPDRFRDFWREQIHRSADSKASGPWPDVRYSGVRASQSACFAGVWIRRSALLRRRYFCVRDSRWGLYRQLPA